MVPGGRRGSAASAPSEVGPASGDPHRRAAAGEPQRERAPEPAGRAGDEDVSRGVVHGAGHPGPEERPVSSHGARLACGTFERRVRQRTGIAPGSVIAPRHDGAGPSPRPSRPRTLTNVSGPRHGEGEAYGRLPPPASRAAAREASSAREQGSGGPQNPPKRSPDATWGSRSPGRGSPRATLRIRSTVPPEGVLGPETVRKRSLDATLGSAEPAQGSPRAAWGSGSDDPDDSQPPRPGLSGMIPGCRWDRPCRLASRLEHLRARRASRRPGSRDAVRRRSFRCGR